VAAQAKKVATYSGDVKWHLAQALRGICEEQRSMIMRNLTGSFDWLHDTGLVVCSHEDHGPCLSSHDLGDGISRNHSVR
jgi:hypothetical protein